MLKSGTDLTATNTAKGRCDIHVWSGDCDHGPGGDSGKRNLRSICGTIPDLDHEVSHEAGSHVSGDYETLY